MSILKSDNLDLQSQICYRTKAVVFSTKSIQYV